MKPVATKALFGLPRAAHILAQPASRWAPWAAATPGLLASILGGLVLAGAGSGPAAAGDVQAGRAKALICQTCHGLDGLSKVPDAPNIAGQTEPYLLTQLQAFKSGARQNDTMSLIVGQLSDDDIANLAAYFSAIEVKIVKIPGE